MERDFIQMQNAGMESDFYTCCNTLVRAAIQRYIPYR